jgi:ABC-type dipeptide/oligopeptide/nickel transport system permease subunit
MDNPRVLPSTTQTVLTPATAQSITQKRGTFSNHLFLFRASLTPHFTVGGFLVALAVLTALLAPLFANIPPDEIDPSNRLLAPSSDHLFGTDALGRDLFSRVVFGSRIALRMSAFSVAIALIPGTLLGLLSGYLRGWFDQIISRLMDVWLSLPGILLAIVLIARLGTSLETTIIALGIAGVPSFFRLARNETLAISQMLYIEAAQSIGANKRRILLRHVLPNLASSIIVLATTRLGTILLAGAGLSFIGLGAQPPDPEWGTLLADSRDYLSSAWWMMVFPGLAITLTTMGFNLMGDGLRVLLFPDRLDH